MLKTTLLLASAAALALANSTPDVVELNIQTGQPDAAPYAD